MIISDGYNYIKQIKDFEMIKGEIYLSFVKRRKVNRITGEVLEEFQVMFDKAVRHKIDTYFYWLDRCYATYLRELEFKEDGERDECLRAFKAEAARIKNSEYTAKVEGRTSA